MLLDSIQQSKPQHPRVLLAGVAGVGKSTMAAGMPSPLFIAAESGVRFLSVPTFEPGGWSDVVELVEELGRNPRGYESLIIDSVDHLEPLCWSYVCAMHNDDRGRKHGHISSWPYGQGYARATTEWRRLLDALDALTDTMPVMLIAHSQVKPFKNPTGEDFDRYEVKLHRAASALLIEWADCVAFAAFDDVVTHVDGRAKVAGSGERVMHLQRRPAWDAKCRWPTPPTLPLDWWELMRHNGASDAHHIDNLAAELSDELQAKVARLFERVKTNEDLTKLLDWVRSKQGDQS